MVTAVSEAILAHAALIRIGFFLGAFALVAAGEILAPRRAQTIGRWRRWPSNLGVVVLDTLLIRAVLPVTAVGLALLAEAHGWGLFHAVPAPFWLAAALSVLMLDLVIYGQHVLFHAVPALWRLHRMHHADLEIDVTTGARFHPLEILLSMLIKLAAVLLLGAPAAAVVAFEVLLNATSMFNHGNLRLPAALDAALRWLVVTPDMHRVHHSILRRETDSNFGFNLPWWDRLFGTYRAAPAAGQLGMMIGIDRFRDPRELRLDRMLLQPFREGREGLPSDSRARNAG
jgi:sterol desaturase/sphingolipid hydroxylase (fatty acid hydroxylase superfamily)